MLLIIHSDHLKYVASWNCLVARGNRRLEKKLGVFFYSFIIPKNVKCITGNHFHHDFVITLVFQYVAHDNGILLRFRWNTFCK